jgi:hypothetical protein
LGSGVNWINRFLEGIGTGFRSTSSQQTLIIIIISAFIVLSLVFYLIQRYVSTERTRQQAHKTFKETLRNVSFTKEEKLLLEKLVDALPNMREKKYLLVQDAAIFSTAAEQLLHDGDITSTEVRSLRNKLDACCFSREKTFVTTKELPEGLHLYITRSSPEGYHGIIIQRRLDFFAVRLKEDAEELEKGSVCSIFFKRRKDTYRINALIKLRKGAILYFSHTEEISKVQKRNFYRSEVNFPAVLRHEGYEVRQYETKMVDLGGGGARLVSPGHGLHQGDMVTLLFQTPEEETVEVAAEIVKISQKNGTEYVHIHFGSIRDKLQDKIISIAMREGE